MARARGLPSVKLSPTFRFIREEDAKLPFRSGEALGTLKEFVELSRLEGHVVVVKEIDGEVLGVALIVVEGKTLTIDRLARDLDHGYKGIGGELILVVEKEIAPHYGAKELRLEAMNEALVKFYKERFGFAPRGPRVRDEEWGWLYPMSKKIGQ
ncbi:MAG: GNAT family N-acetyltransferase [Candidatus Thermoplasmatota archaeon]